MKKKLLSGIFVLCVLLPVISQESDDLLEADDLSSLFDVSEEENDDLPSIEDLFNKDSDTEEDGEESQDSGLSVLESLTSKTGYTFELRYAFVGGLSPGWGETPWNSGETPPDDGDGYSKGYTTVYGADIGSKAILDLQLTRNFRVKQSYAFRFPDFDPSISEFWGSYNLNNIMYMRMGLQNIKWGLGRNYSYTNVLTRLPADAEKGGDSFSFLMDIPMGLGGVQLLALARSGFSSGGLDDMTASDVGYGIKYNYASEFADLNIGSFFHQDMPLRTVASVTRTLWDRTEVYAEGLWAVDYENFADHTYSFSFGFFDSFFDDKLYFNTEYYWNGEETIYYVDDDESLIILEKAPFIYGHNIAWNLVYRPIKGNSLNLFCRGMYNINENTAKVVPGVRYKPMKEITLFLSVPMALGDRDGTYYRNNYDDKNRPFSITFGVRFDGSYKQASYK